MIIEPKKISKNLKIGLVAPSFGCTMEPYYSRLKASIETFKSLNYQVVEGENIYLEKGVVSSNTPKKRAEEFNKMYKSDVDVIFSVGGGELMCEILPFIDFEMVKKLPPKWFIGFSDNTNLTFTLTTISNVMTIYGPCGNKFYHYPFKYDSKDTFRLINGSNKFIGYKKYEINSLASEENPLTDYNLTEKKIIKKYKYNGPFKGILLGGCLDCLITLCGTKFDNMKEFNKNNQEIIWYLEACDLNPLDIRRALFQLKEADWFKNTKGFLIGRPLCQDQNIMGLDKYKATIDILKSFNVPILMDVDLGHLPPSLPIKNGANAKVELINNNSNIKITYL